MDLNVLKRFLNHSASSEDYKKINQWRSEDPSNSNFLFALEELWSKKDEAKYATKRHLKISYKKMMKKIMSKSDNKIEGQNLQNIHLRKNKTYFFLRITASIAILLSIGLGVLYYMDVTQPVGSNTVIVPNSQIANLLLEDGTKIWLNSLSMSKCFA